MSELPTDITALPFDDNYVSKTMTEHFESWAATGKINSNEYVNLMNLAKRIHTERDNLLRQLWGENFQIKNLLMKPRAKKLQRMVEQKEEEKLSQLTTIKTILEQNGQPLHSQIEQMINDQTIAYGKALQDGEKIDTEIPSADWDDLPGVDRQVRDDYHEWILHHRDNELI